MKPEDKIYISGHNGLVGSAISRALKSNGFENLSYRTHKELDLTDPNATEDFFEQERPNFVFLAAGKVGGIYANSTYPAEFIRENLLIQTHVLHYSWRTRVKKLLFLGSSCIYPKYSPQPIPESALLTGELESTNNAYAIAKISGIQACKAYRKQYGINFIAVMPTNLYGPNDNFHPKNSHVLPGLLQRFHEAKKNGLQDVQIWGTGTPRREFLYSDDLADACVFLMEHYDSEEIINVGWGIDQSISELAKTIAGVVGYQGKITLDTSHPDGTQRKILDCNKIKGLGWQPKIPLIKGLEKTYQWYLKNEITK